MSEWIVIILGGVITLFIVAIFILISFGLGYLSVHLFDHNNKEYYDISDFIGAGVIISVLLFIFFLIGSFVGEAIFM